MMIAHINIEIAIKNLLKFTSDNSRTKKVVKIYCSSLTVKLSTDRKNLSSTKTQLSQFIFPVILPHNISALMALTNNEFNIISVIIILNILQGINISF